MHMRNIEQTTLFCRKAENIRNTNQNIYTLNQDNQQTNKFERIRKNSERR